MKRYILSSEEITNNYLHELFKKIDWDDVDYADNIINTLISKKLGVDKNRIFDQAKYINMLDEADRNDLMSLLEDPKAIHDRRMKNRRKRKSSKGAAPVTLQVKYEDYPDGNIKSASVSGTDLLDAFKQLVDKLLLYIDVDEIEDNNMSAEEILESIEERNGDGCDYIIKLVNKSTGEILMDYPVEDYDD